MAPAVSVVMPAYNAERFIREAIESVLTQSFGDFEVIVMDDGSSDGTRDIAQEYAVQDERVLLVSRENRGQCASLNEAIERAHAKWIAVMHADDVMESNRLERQLAFIAENPDLAVVSSFVHHIDSNGREIGKYRSQYTSRETVQRARLQNELIGFHHPAAMLRKDAVQAVGGYRSAFWVCEDIDLWNRLVEQDFGILVQPEFLLRYRIHAGSASIAHAWSVQLVLRWVRECMLARRSGRREPSWESFRAQQANLPVHVRLNQRRKDLAKVLYKDAVFKYSERRYVSFAVSLVRSMVLQPAYTFRQAATKLLG